jgi:hypothetical protein
VTDATWFFDFLGLEPGAGAPAIRRAYATRLKAIDQTIGVAAFARLRESYEAALRWKPDIAVTSDRVAGAAASDIEASTQALEAERLIVRFVASLADTSDEDLPGLFEATTAVLRQQYVDAPSALEDRLVDLLVEARLPRRRVLFDVAYAHFHWAELDRVRELGERGEWIDAVVAQKLAWDQRGGAIRDAWTSLLSQASLTHEAAARDPAFSWPDDLVARWPEARYLLETLGDHVGLVIDPATVEAWQGHYEALPDTRRKRAEAKAAAPIARARRSGRRTRRPGWLRYLLAGVLIGLALALAQFTHVFASLAH